MDSQVAVRETTTICESGEIIRTLSPPRLATLSELKRGHETQLEVANSLDRSSSLISKHLSALEELPVSLVNKTDLAITAAGNAIFNHLKSLARRLDIDLDKIDFQGNPSDIDYCLSPLYSARGPLLFLVFHSIGVNNSLGNRIDLYQQEQVQTATIVSDVESRQQDRGEGVRRKQVRWQLKQLAQADSILFENERIQLTDKGEAQLRFFEDIVQTIEDEHGEELPRSIPERSQFTPNGWQDTGINIDIESDQMDVVPELQIADDAITLSDGMTISELIEQITHLTKSHDYDSELSLKLMLRSQATESETQ
ncbi:hypothetical protein [Halocatena halophila]|uniref:hypothetical protein n=1 Tax=Halocatena halophila TaxID=2814576 RepID=UPI002ED517D8